MVIKKVNMKDTDFNKLAKKAYTNAKAKGFHDKLCTDAHCLMLVACELAEAVEADRSEKRADRKQYKRLAGVCEERLQPYLFEMYIKDTVEDELADAVIRLLDFVGYKGMDIPKEYITVEQIKVEAEEVRGWMNGKSFADMMFTSCVVNMESAKDIPEYMIYSIFVIAELYGIDLLWHIEEKMKYNETRDLLHGKLY